MSAAASAAFCGMGTGSGRGFVGTAGAFNCNGKTFKNTVELIRSATGTDNASAVFLGNGTANLKALSAGVTGERIERHLFLPD